MAFFLHSYSEKLPLPLPALWKSVGHPRAGRPWGVEDSYVLQPGLKNQRPKYIERKLRQGSQIPRISGFIMFHLISSDFRIIETIFLRVHDLLRRYIGCQPSTKCVVQLVAPRDEVVSAPVLPSGTGPPIANWPWVSATNNKSECPI